MTIRQRIIQWLDIEKPKDWSEDIKQAREEFDKEAAKLRSDIDYWKGIAESFSEVPCAHCQKPMYVYPFGGAYYITGKNKKVHTGCYDAYLEEQNNERI